MGGLRTLFDKLWESHVVADLGAGASLLYVDRNFVHDLSGTRAMKKLREQGREPRHPDLTFAVPDHTVSTDPGARDEGERFERCVVPLRDLSGKFGVKYFGAGEPGHGIFHVIGPELGLTQPGTLITCSDSHTCTHGALGALAWGIGASEVVHVLATGTIVQRRPKRMRVLFDGHLGEGVTAKDLILYLIGRDGAGAGDGYAVEYAGSAIRRMEVEERMTVCNLSIEMGAKIGLMAPDDKTIEYVSGRPFAPKEKDWESAVAYWRGLAGDPGTPFDREISVDMMEVAPQVTWGTSPEHTAAVDGVVPDPDRQPDPVKRNAMAAALDYVDLLPGTPVEGIPIDRVFIGSCTNGRISDYRAAAAVVRGHKVADGVTAWAVPGSEAVKAEAEAEGLDVVFRDAGFEWRNPGCSLCVGANGEQVAAGERCVSTSNRNFVGRQGKGSRTHLASPITVAASALAGHIADPRPFLRGAH